MRGRTYAVALTFGLLAPLAVAAPAAAYDWTPVECEHSVEQLRATGLELINLLRRWEGAPPLRPHPELDAVAQRWSQVMARTGVFEHNPTFIAEYPPGFNRGGENIATGMDNANAAGELQVVFFYSPGHRQNMVNPGFTHLGLGYACVRNPYGLTLIYSTQNLAGTPEQALLEPAPAPMPRPSSIANACPPQLGAPTRFYDILPHGHGHAVLCLDGWGVVDHTHGRYWQSEERYYLPDFPATRAELAAMLHGLLVAADAAPTGSATGPFRDVPASHPHARAINALAELGIARGVSSDRFDPNRLVTRGQMASLLAGGHEIAFARTLPTGDNFTDTRGSTHERNIRRLAGSGITSGFPDGTFRPGEEVSRGQLATFHARYADLLVREGLVVPPITP